MRDIDRDRFMTPEEAVEYGLVDAVMERQPGAEAQNQRVGGQ
jgi:ATP-dependent protease ClpP protease subunit